MSNYHITQEQAWELWKETTPLNGSPSERLQAFANAVLDEVLGEPVGEVTSEPALNIERRKTIITPSVYKLPPGTKLYAPKEY